MCLLASIYKDDDYDDDDGEEEEYQNCYVTKGKKEWNTFLERRDGEILTIG